MTRSIRAEADDLRELALDGFPVISDFFIELHDAGDGGKHLAYVGAAEGRLADFPAWDHVDRDLRHFTPGDVPIGSIDEPYDDADDAWRILIFEHGGWVYVLEGPHPRATDFPRFFRVQREQYLAAWAAVIDRYNPVTPLALEEDDENEEEEAQPDA